LFLFCLPLKFVQTFLPILKGIYCNPFSSMFLVGLYGTLDEWQLLHIKFSIQTHNVKVTEAKFNVFYKVSILYCLNILLYLLFDNTISKTRGGFLPFGWDSKVSLLLAGISSTLVDNGKSLFLQGDELDFCCRLQC